MTYLTRRGAVYYFQVRLIAQMSLIFGRAIFRQTLATNDPIIAKRQLRSVLSWFGHMNEVVDEFESHAQWCGYQIGNIDRELKGYLEDCWPIDDERLWQRKNFEVMVNNFKRGMLSEHKVLPREHVSGFDETFLKFISQTLEFEDSLMRAKVTGQIGADRQREVEELKAAAHSEAYQRGRDDERETAHSYMSLFATRTPPMTTAVVSVDVPASPVQCIQPAPSSLEQNGASLDPEELIVEPKKPFTPSPPLSELLETYFDQAQEDNGHDKVREEGSPLLNYFINCHGTLSVHELNASLLLDFYQSLIKIPNRHGIPRKHSTSFADRLAYADEYGWNDLVPYAEATLRKNHRHKLKGFLKFLDATFGLELAKQEFTLKKVQKATLRTSTPRDSLRASEIISFFSSALFTGSKSARKRFVPGKLLIMDHLYWWYLINIFSGMRPHEPADLKLDDINLIEGHWYFDLRTHDPSEGPVVIGDLEQGKTTNAARVIPVSPALIEFGLLQRCGELRAMGAIHFLPETLPYTRASGAERGSQEFSKHFGNNKKKFGITRKDVHGYSLRDNYKDELSAHKVDEEVRERLIGHATGSAKGAYGSKGELLEPLWQQVTQIDNPAMLEVIRLMKAAQSAAKSGELTLIKPHLNKAIWKRNF